MALFDRNSKFNKTGFNQKDFGENAQKPKGISGFGGEHYITRNRFNNWLKRPERFDETKLPLAERQKIGKELGSEFGSYINKEETGNALRKLEAERIRTSNHKERLKIDNKIALIKDLLGRK